MKELIEVPSFFSDRTHFFFLRLLAIRKIIKRDIPITIKIPVDAPFLISSPAASQPESIVLSSAIINKLQAKLQAVFFIMIYFNYPKAKKIFLFAPLKRGKILIVCWINFTRVDEVIIEGTKY